MEERKREILQRVARGELAPEEAAARLEEIEEAGAGGPDHAEELELPPASRPSPVSGVREIRIVSEFGAVQIVGDGSVREAVADGPHSVRQEQDRLVIEHSTVGQVGDFFFSRGSDIRGSHHRLLVRMNPALALDLQSTAGSVRINDLRGPITASVQAGSTVIEGFRGPLRLSSQAGSVRAAGVPVEGDSRITCLAGSIRVHLGRGSDVRVRARAQMGKVRIEGARRSESTGIGNSTEELVLGEGRASLEIDASMGSIRVETE